MDIKALWDAIIGQNAAALRSFFHPDAVIRWHCTNEQFTLEEYIRANCEYPGAWLGDIERCIQAGSLIILAGHVHAADCSISCHVASFITLRAGLISAMDEYWGDDGPAPAWRQNMHIGIPLSKDNSFLTP